VTPDRAAAQDGRPRLVTISATYGAGGPVVAPLLARRLGLPFADRLPSPGSGPARASEEQITDDEADATPRHPVLEGFALLATAWNIPVPRQVEDLPERLRAANEATLRDLIDRGGAVVLGRAAAIALGRDPAAFHVRLDGPPDRRARRGSSWEGIDLDTARSRLEAADGARSQYVQRLYGRDPADPSLYHLVLDTTVLAVDTVLDLITTAAGVAWAHDDSRLAAEVAALRARLADPTAT
jgi:cytidylate kinase